MLDYLFHVHTTLDFPDGRHEGDRVSFREDEGSGEEGRARHQHRFHGGLSAIFLRMLLLRRHSLFHRIFRFFDFFLLFVAIKRNFHRPKQGYQPHQLLLLRVQGGRYLPHQEPGQPRHGQERGRHQGGLRLPNVRRHQHGQGR